MVDEQCCVADKTRVQKSTGVTRAERYLKRLCDRTFLSLWSYPSVFRDQGGGKEVCDLLVVFRDHVILFSDKDCSFPDSDDLAVDWNRWYRKAVQESAKQIWGAERWIRDHPDRLFLDAKCQQRFPIELPAPRKATFHRVIVAHSSTIRCRQEMGGGSGSLMIASEVVGNMHYAGQPHNGKPFCIGKVDPSKGFLHVLDDTSLEIVLQTLDTVSDFVAYLQKKEQFFNEGISILASGEEDLLAFYLSRLNDEEEHDFVFERDYAGVCIKEGEWEAFRHHPQRLAQIEANKISYTWDALIETFCHHILAGTQRLASPAGVVNGEKIMRIMASENRIHRRMLSRALLDLMRRPVPKDHRAVRVYKPDVPGHPYYVFLLLANPDLSTHEDYREVRWKLLEACCMAAKLRFPDAQDIVGIATEPGTGIERSEDAIYLDAREWTVELDKEAAVLCEELGLLKNLKVSYSSETEYPSDAIPPKIIVGMKGRDRNMPCPCGSGRKFKKCCGRNISDNPEIL